MRLPSLKVPALSMLDMIESPGGFT